MDNEINNQPASDTPRPSNDTPSTNRSSNLRSRWKRKDGGAVNSRAGSQNQQNQPSCGEIDPATLRANQSCSHSPDQCCDEQPTVACDVSNICEKPADAPQVSHDRMKSNSKNTYTPKEAQGRPERTDRGSRFERNPRHEKLEKSDKPARTGITRAHTKVTPATYRPTALPSEGLWSRLKSFFSDLIGSTSAKSSAKTASHSRSSRSEPRSGDSQRRFSSGGGKGGYRSGSNGRYGRSGGRGGNRNTYSRGDNQDPK